MCEVETALNNFENSYRHLNGSCKFQKTGSPNIFCSKLPVHWRSNKSLPTPFIVLLLDPVPDGTKVTVAAGNEENFTADVKNNVTETNAQMARFSDLRFVGKSGRGKNFNITITIHTSPLTQVAIVTNVIKVTVDGPRDSRNASKFMTDYRKRLAPFDMLPSTSQLDFSHSTAKRGRFGRLLPNGNFGDQLSMIANGGAPGSFDMNMFMAAVAAPTLNPMMLSMLSTVPPSILPLAPNPLSASQLELFPMPPLAYPLPISCSASIIDPLHKSLNSNTINSLNPAFDMENHTRPDNHSGKVTDHEKEQSSLWRPYNSSAK